jgi:hypothetical protein
MHEAAGAHDASSRADRLPRLITFLLIAGVGIWLAANAVYRADDYGLVSEAWRGGNVVAALRHWFELHVTPQPEMAWPKFYRPVWSLSYLVDAHVFGCQPAASALLSWALHATTAWWAGRLCLQLTSSPAARWFVTWLCLLPGAAQQAVFWIAARGTLLATLGTVLALVVALAAAPLTWRRRAAVCACLLLAAAGNEVGLMATPLVAAAILLRPGESRREHFAAAAVLVLVTAAWVCWRRVMLGCWVGGYAPVPGSGASLTEWPLTVLVGTGAVAVFGHGPVPSGWLLAAGAIVLATLGAFVGFGRAAPRGARTQVLLALAMIGLLLAPFAGVDFRTDDDTNGRSLYPTHIGWSLAAGGALHAALVSNRWRRPARVVATAFAAGAAIAFVATLLACGRALATTRTLFASLAEIQGRELTVLLNLPDRDGPFLIARNALPAAMQPPFRGAAPLPFAYATDLDFAHGVLTGLSAALPSLPNAAVWHWESATQRFVAGWWPPTATWRGRITIGADGAITCSGLRVLAGANRATDGAWVELHGEVQGAGQTAALHRHETRPWTPLLQVEGGDRWRYRGLAGDWVFVLAGSVPCCIALGGTGSLGIVQPLVLPVGVADASGTFVFSLPAPAAGAPFLQTLVLRGPASQATFGEVHALAR